jgi:hypothetical protein
MTRKIAFLVILFFLFGCNTFSDSTKSIHYNTADILEKAHQFLNENYNLPNGSVSGGKIKEYTGSILTISNEKFRLKYLIVRLDLFSEEYGNISLDEAIQKDCEEANNTNTGISYVPIAALNDENATIESPSEYTNPISIEECKSNLKEFYNTYYFPVLMCPIELEPSQITGIVGPGGRCFQVANEDVSPKDQNLMETFGDGYRIRYIRNILKIDPYHEEADKLVSQFLANITNAKWQKTKQKVLEVQFDISIRELGCNPYSIDVFFDENSRPITANEDVMCAD